MNPLKKAAVKQKEIKEDKKLASSSFQYFFTLRMSIHDQLFLLVQTEAKQTAEVFEEFVASFEETEKTGKTFVRGTTFNPEKKPSKFCDILCAWLK